jgi:hypothetical protein
MSTTKSLREETSVENLLNHLAYQAQDASESLDKFVSDRFVVLNNQKRALAEYDAEILAIEREGRGEIDDLERYTHETCRA